MQEMKLMQVCAEELDEVALLFIVDIVFVTSCFHDYSYKKVLLVFYYE